MDPKSVATHTMKYYSPIKKAKTWMNLENTMLNEGSQSQRTTYSYDSIYMKCPEEASLQRQKVV